MARSISSESPSSSKAGRFSVADSTAWAALASSAASKAAWVMASRVSSRISTSVTSDTELRICCCSLSARVMGTACGRASVLSSALIHTKTGAHREDVAQHAGDRFGSPITRRPDAAALSDGADSPPVSIPVLRMPPRKPQMTGSEIAQRLPHRATSQSVTSTGQNRSLLLQIEINNLSRSETSKSVTVTGRNW